MHAVIEALEGEKAVVLGSDLETRASQIRPRRIVTGVGRNEPMSYQAVGVCQGLTAVPPAAGASV